MLASLDEAGDGERREASRSRRSTVDELDMRRRWLYLGFGGEYGGRSSVGGREGNVAVGEEKKGRVAGGELEELRRERLGFDACRWCSAGRRGSGCWAVANAWSIDWVNAGSKCWPSSARVGVRRATFATACAAMERLDESSTRLPRTDEDGVVVGVLSAKPAQIGRAHV